MLPAHTNEYPWQTYMQGALQDMRVTGRKIATRGFPTVVMATGSATRAWERDEMTLLPGNSTNASMYTTRAMRSGTFEYRIWHQAPPAEWHTTDVFHRLLSVNTWPE